MKPVSYDNYHILWKGIATSITDYKRTNQCKSLLIHNIPYSVYSLWLFTIVAHAVTRLLDADTKLGRVHHEQIRILETKLEQ